MVKVEDGKPRYIQYAPQVESIGRVGNDVIPFPIAIVDPFCRDFNSNKRFAIESGAVILRLAIDSTGKVGDAQVLQGTEDRNEAAMNAVKKWRFAPAHDQSGKAIASEAYAVCEGQ